MMKLLLFTMTLSLSYSALANDCSKMIGKFQCNRYGVKFQVEISQKTSHFGFKKTLSLSANGETVIIDGKVRRPYEYEKAVTHRAFCEDDLITIEIDKNEEREAEIYADPTEVGIFYTIREIGSTSFRHGCPRIE